MANREKRSCFTIIIVQSFHSCYISFLTTTTTTFILFLYETVYSIWFHPQIGRPNRGGENNKKITALNQYEQKNEYKRLHQISKSSFCYKYFKLDYAINVANMVRWLEFEDDLNGLINFLPFHFKIKTIMRRELGFLKVPCLWKKISKVLKGSRASLSGIYRLDFHGQRKWSLNSDNI